MKIKRRQRKGKMGSNRYNKLIESRKKYTDGLYVLQVEITDNLTHSRDYEYDQIANATNELIQAFTDYNKALIELLEELRMVTGGVNEE